MGHVKISPQKEEREKRSCSGRGEGRLYGREPDLKVKLNKSVYSEIVVLLMSTNQRIQPGLTRGQESARLPPACVHNITSYSVKRTCIQGLDQAYDRCA